LLTLFTTPIVYIYMDKLSRVVSRSRPKPAPYVDATRAGCVSGGLDPALSGGGARGR
jgi:hypothetical protein